MQGREEEVEGRGESGAEGGGVGEGHRKNGRTCLRRFATIASSASCRKLSHPLCMSGGGHLYFWKVILPLTSVEAPRSNHFVSQMAFGSSSVSTSLW